MKKLLIMLPLLIMGCSEPDYIVVKTTVVKGVVSANQREEVGDFVFRPIVYIQTNTSTVRIEVPFKNEGDYKVGDSAKVIIQQVEKIK